ncbi:MAG: VCBS repeat-containing protein [Ignavibacteria bacterium]|nr:VCBS repeat-containing protein [Ignavibacteria bacterium]
MKTIINKYLHYLSVIIFIISINAIILSEETFAQTYLSDDVEVPVFGYTHEPFTKYIFWDISEINIQNNRLDITVGLIEDGINADPNYTHANWYENAMNDNFNSEDVDLRMIYATNLSNTINGLMFAKLTTSSSKKDLIITRGNGDLEVYWNDNGELIFKRKFKANGKVATIGNFTSGDNLEDVAVIMNDTVKIYKNLGNGYLDSIPVYRLANVHASSVILAQISSYTEPYRTLNNTTSDKDEIIIKQGDSVKIFLNNNSNGTSASTIIYTGSSPSNYKDFKISDFNNDGYNDLVIVENYYGINLYKNNEGSISTTAAYSNTNSGLFDVTSVAAGDFNKDGWNDFAINGSDFTNYI